MAGQLIERGDQTWLVRVFKGRDAAGKRVYVSETVKGTKKQAQARLNKLLTNKDDGALLEPSKETVSAYLARWLQVAAKNSVRARTLHDYHGVVKRYIAPHMGTLKLARLTPVHIQAAYVTMQDGGLSARTVRYAHAVLHAALKQAVLWRLIPSNPAEAVKLPKMQRRQMETLDVQQAKLFIEIAAADRFHALWLILLTTGMRPGEALALRWSDVRNGVASIQRTLVVRAGLGKRFEQPKTDRSRRSIILTPMVKSALAAHRKGQAKEKLKAGAEYRDQDLIFADRHGAPQDIARISRRFKRIIKLVHPTLRMYDLRHSYVSLMLAAGESLKVVSSNVGHSTITLTADTYAHILAEQQQASTDRMQRLLGT